MCGNVAGAPFLNMYALGSWPNTLTELTPKSVFNADAGYPKIYANTHSDGVKPLRLYIEPVANNGNQVCVFFPSGGSLLGEW